MTKLVTPANSLNELIAYDGDAFVECAYLTLLGRTPDFDGYLFYTRQLKRTGDKLSILLQMFDSHESKQFHCDVSGLRAAMRQQRLIKFVTSAVPCALDRAALAIRDVLSGNLDRAVWRHSRAPAARASSPEDILDLRTLRESALYDDAWYLATYQDVRITGIDGAEHYFKLGASELRDPGPAFSTRGYLTAYSDVVRSGINPLIHYIRYGQEEGRQTFPLDFDRERSNEERYEHWQAVNNWNPRAETDLIERLRSATGKLPFISIVMPVYRPEIRFLRKAIQSVTAQVFKNWELCIADDASGDDAVLVYLQSLSMDPRISVTFRQTNGHISNATNSAAAMARGEFILFLDQDDELSKDALAEVALYISENPQADLVYSDSDKVTHDGKQYDPHFKPDWSPELLLTYMFAGQALTVRRELYFEIGGMRAGFEGSQDHDLALRISERSRHVGHIARVLYHWRCLPGSTAMSGSAKPYSFDAGRRAVQEALQRRGSGGRVVRPQWTIDGGNSFFQVESPDDGPSVGIIIPTKNGLIHLKRCISSLEHTSYRNYTVLVIDNESDDEETLEYLRIIRHTVVRVENAPGEGFNFSRLQNIGVKLMDVEYVLLLNNDTEVLNDKWLSNMVGIAQLPGVGACGAKLTFSDGSIQHAGVSHGLKFGAPNRGGLCGHTHKGLGPADHGYLSGVEALRNCAAVTAACLLTPRALYLRTGGFDEQHLAVAYNDADYCYRLRACGYRVVYVPNAQLIHHEGKTRAKGDKPQEIAWFRAKYWQATDPYLNPNLTRDGERLMIAARRVAARATWPIRLLMVSHNLNFEGAPIQLHDVAFSLQSKGEFEITIFSPVDGPLRDRFEAIGARVVVGRTPLHSGRTHREYALGLRSFCLDIEGMGPEVILSNTLETFYAIDAAAKLRIPSLWLVHESEGMGYFRDFEPAMERQALQCFEFPYRVLFVSEATRKIYKGLDRFDRFEVIPNALAGHSYPVYSHSVRNKVRADLGYGMGDIVFLSLGTVCERKGQLDIVAALALIDLDEFAGRVPRFLIVGDRDNEYSAALHAAIKALPPEKQRLLKVVVETRDTGGYYNAADVFLFCSRLESYPRVTLEAMAIGLPILTTPVQGISEQVQEGFNAEFFRPGNAKRMAWLVREFAVDDAKRDLYGRQSADAYQALVSFEEMGTEYARVVREARLASVPLRVSRYMTR